MGQMTQPTVPKRTEGSSSSKHQVLIPPGPPTHSKLIHWYTKCIRTQKWI